MLLSPVGQNPHSSLLSGEFESELAEAKYCSLTSHIALAYFMKHSKPTMHCMQIGLYDPQGPHTSLKYVHISDKAKGPPTALGLEEALPLPHLLTPVGSCKEGIVAAIDSLEPDTTASMEAPHNDDALGTRSFGGALQAVLRCCAVLCCAVLCCAVSPGFLVTSNQLLVVQASLRCCM